MTYIPNNCNGGTGGTGGTGGGNSHQSPINNIIVVCCNKKIPSILCQYDINFDNLPSGFGNCDCNKNNFDPISSLEIDPFHQYLVQKRREKEDKTTKFILIFVAACCFIVIINTFMMSSKVSQILTLNASKKFKLLDLIF